MPNKGTRRRQVMTALGEGVTIAFDAIRANRVRAGLTILGIAVGVFVVTVMSAAVHGIDAGVRRAFDATGPNTFYVTRWPPQVNACAGEAESCAWMRDAPISVHETEVLAQLPSVQEVVAHVQTSAAVRWHDRSIADAQIQAEGFGWMSMNGGSINPGRDFTPQEGQNAAHVAVINDALVNTLAPGQSLNGKTILLGGQSFEVIGIYHSPGTIFDAGNTPMIVVPFETAHRVLSANMDWMDMAIKPRAHVSRDDAMDDVTATLRMERRLRPAQDNTFFVFGNEKFMQLYNKTILVFFLVMIVLSAIGLMVGGVGVVAIMMISVTERTREIGVRKALGATRGMILWQFLVEAATLTTIGAVIGLVLGGLLAWLIRDTTPVAASIPPLAIVASLVMSALTGVLFGLLPAIRAAGLDPIAALRYE